MPHPKRNFQELDKAQQRSDTLVMLLAGGEGKALGALTSGTAKPAIPFAGKYRVIDFVLSNVVNSNLDRIAVLTQFGAQSVSEHLQDDILWGADQRPSPEIQVWQASLQRTGQEHYHSTADAVYQNREFILKEDCKQVLIMAGDIIYQQDYRDLLRFHREKNADLTMGVMSIPPEESRRFGMVEVDQNQRVTRFVEKPEKSASRLGSMAVYVFNTAFLLRCLEEDALNEASLHDFGLDIIPPLIGSAKVYAYHYNGYWTEFGAIEAYWKANLALLGDEPTLNLRAPDWMLPLRSSHTAPADIRPGGVVKSSLVTEGCVIAGEVAHSVLSPGVRVEAGAMVRDSIILSDTVIHRGARVERCVLGNQVEIGFNARVGTSADEADGHPNAGITLVGQGARIPENSTIGSNCTVDEYVTPDDFGALQIHNGSTVKKSAA